MTNFVLTMGGYEVKINEKHIGYIGQGRFFSDPTVIKSFVELSAADLRTIANKVEESKK